MEQPISTIQVTMSIPPQKYMAVEHAEKAILEGLNRALTTHRDNPFTKVIIWDYKYDVHRN